MEADALGITASAAELEDQLSNRTPAFSGADGKFDPARFDRFAQGILQPEGFSKSQIDLFLRGEVRLRKVAELLASLAPPTPDEIGRKFLRARLSTEASYVEVKAADFRKDQKVTEEEIKKQYEAKKDSLKTEEKRKVRFAAFTLPPAPEKKPADVKPADGKPPEEPKRTEELQQLANAAYDFAASLVQPGANFDELAKAAGATLGETAEFFSEHAGPAEIEGSPQAAAAAFTLTKEKPYSTHISPENGKGTYVLMLKEIKPPEQQTIEQARKQLEAELLDEKTDTAMRARAEEIRGKLAEARKAGKSFYDAAQALGVKAEPFPPFSMMKPPPPDANHGGLIPMHARKLAPGEISEVIAEDGVALVIHVDQRPAVDEKGMAEERARIAKMIEGGQMGMTFAAWLAERRQAAGLKDPEPR